MPDEEYMEWLRETHPDIDFSLYNVSSLEDYFSNLPVATPVEVTTMQLELDNEFKDGSS